MKKILIVLVILGAGSGGLALWWPTDGTAADGAPATARVERRDLSTTVLATGAVRPQTGAEVRVGARISGTVTRLHANTGDAVTAGAVVAELDRRELEAVVETRQADLALAENRRDAVAALAPTAIAEAEVLLAEREAQVVLLTAELKRQRSLHAEDMTSTGELERAQEAHAVAAARRDAAATRLARARAEAELDAARTAAEVDRARAALAEARTRLAYATITAPIAGVVADVTTQRGETVAAGLNAPTFVTIVDLDRLLVEAYIDEIDIGAIAVGQRVVFVVDAHPGHEFPGRVAAIHPTAVLRDNVVSYVVEVAIDPPAKADDATDAAGLPPTLRPEMTAAVTIATESLPDALVLPARAIHRRSGATVVHRLRDGTAEAVPVTVGRQVDGLVQLIGGIAVGDTVLLDPPVPERTP